MAVFATDSSNHDVRESTVHVVDAHNVRKKYGEITALDGVDLRVFRGEIFGILGPNGAGKTTLIEILEGRRRPDSGDVRVLGNDVVADGEVNVGTMGVAAQKTALPQLLRVHEVIELFSALVGAHELVRNVLSDVGLSQASGSLVHTLSGGQTQRLAIAVATLGSPKLLFLDEPTSELDPHGRRLIWDQLLSRRAKTDATIILTTHQMEEAELLCDRVAIVNNGKILSVGSPRDLIDRHYRGKVVRFTTRAGADFGIAGAIVTPRRSQPSRCDVAVSTEDLNGTISHVMALAAQLALPVDELAVDSATLEDVFLTLTSRD